MVPNFLSLMGQASALFVVVVAGQALIRRYLPPVRRRPADAAFLCLLAAGLAALPAAPGTILAFLAAALLFSGAGPGVLVLALVVLVRLVRFDGPANLVFLPGMATSFALVWLIRIWRRPVMPFRARDLLLCGIAAGAGAAVIAVLSAVASTGGLVSTIGVFLAEGAAAVFYFWLVHLEIERRESADNRIQRRMHEDIARTGLAASSTEFVARTDMDGRIIDISDGYLARMGYSREEIRGRRLETLRADGQRGDIRALAERLREGGAVTYEVVHLTRAGERVPFDVTAVCSERGDSFNAFLRDTSERKRAEREISEQSAALRDALEKTIAALSTALGAHSLVPDHQVWRMRTFVARLGTAYGLDPHRLEGLGLAAMVNDIGEIAIPAEILNRPRRLNADEMELVRGHCAAGHDILKDIRFPWPIAEIVFQHHENFDGSGYPRGLAGPAILPEARIIRVADSVMAMLSHRPFRRAFDRAHVIDELLAGAGHLYDPEIAAAAVAILREEQEAAAGGKGKSDGRMTETAA